MDWQPPSFWPAALRRADGEEYLGTVTLAEYKGVTVNVSPAEVTDEEVENRIQSVLSQNQEEVEVDRAAEDGDVVNIDYTGYQDGEEFVGGSAEGEDLTLGSGSMIDGFEEGMWDLRRETQRSLTLTFPEDYREQALAGQEVVFDMTVNSVKEKRDPELTDEFVQSISDYQTVDEYREGIRQEMLEQKQESVIPADPAERASAGDRQFHIRSFAQCHLPAV